MQRTLPRTAVLVAAFFAAVLSLYSQDAPGAAPAAVSKDTRPDEVQGIPARATPNDYQAHAQAGSFTVAAEYIGHFVPTSAGTYTTEDFVVVETALFGEAAARLKLSLEDFSLRINGRKMPYASQPAGLVTSSLKDPELEPLASASKSKSSIGTDNGGQSETPPPPFRIPVEIRRAMGQRVQKASLAQGDRALPQAGFLFFQYRGQPKDIRSMELVYQGPAGQAIVTLTR